MLPEGQRSTWPAVSTEMARLRRDRTSVPWALSLTAEKIRAVHSAPGEDDRSSTPLLTDEEIEASMQTSLRELARDQDLWLFGYGSLMWKPEMEFAEQRIARLSGWHRRFCLWQWRYRGTTAKPALMLALDAGGSCRGVAYRISPPDIAARVRAVWRREMIGKGYEPRWVTLQTAQGPVTAVTFVANRRGQRYAGRLSEVDVANYIASACGHIGPSADYLLETVRHCEAIGVYDPMLRRLERLVAERLDALLAAGDGRIS